MKTPRNLKQAIQNGYIIYKLYAKENKRIRVDLQARFYQPGMKIFLSFWVDRNYFKRNYPNTYERL